MDTPIFLYLKVFNTIFPFENWKPKVCPDIIEFYKKTFWMDLFEKL